MGLCLEAFLVITQYHWQFREVEQREMVWFAILRIGNEVHPGH